MSQIGINTENGKINIGSIYELVLSGNYEKKDEIEEVSALVKESEKIVAYEMVF